LNKPRKPAAIISYDEKPLCASDRDDGPAAGACKHASFARSLLAGIDLLSGKVHALVKDRHRSASSSNSSSFSTPLIWPAL
jgi:hypothetical protein